MMSDKITRLRAQNRKTALVLLAIVLIFFFGIIATRFIHNQSLGIGVVGLALVLFIAIAIGRNLWNKE